MPLYEVTEHAGEFLNALEDEHYKNFVKSHLCDAICSLIDRADENHTATEDLPMLSMLSDICGAINELSNSRKCFNKQNA